MDSVQEILWKPSAEDMKASRLTQYKVWLREHHDLTFTDYESLWQWSFDHPEMFWETIVHFFNVHFHSPYKSVLSGGPMPDAVWFEGGTLNYAEHIFKGMKEQETAMLFASESESGRTSRVEEMWKEVSRFQAYYKKHGVEVGDRLAGYLPNIPEATYAFLAAISLGAVWSCCSPDFGVSSVVDRFAQIQPKLFITADGYQYNGTLHDRTQEIKVIRSSLLELKNTLIIE